MKKIVVSGGFDNLRSRDSLFLDKASEQGDLHAVMWDDEALREMMGGYLVLKRVPKEGLPRRESTHLRGF